MNADDELLKNLDKLHTTEGHADEKLDCVMPDML